MNNDQKVEQIAIEDIIPNRFQPRLSFDEQGLKELSDSIKQHGVIQPIVLRRLGNKYEIIAGERRYKASTMAGLKTVPAIVSDIDDNKSAEIALVENIQRRNLTAIEEAKSYRNLLDRGYMTQEQLAAKMGVSQSTIANKLRLLNLSQEVQDALLEEKISERHARSLLAIPKEEQNEWLKKIIDKRMTVRQLDLEIKKYKNEDENPITSPIDNQPQGQSTTNFNDNLNNNPSEDDNVKEIKMTEQQPIISNKFFNFLEDEAANMNMELDTNKEENNIEVLENIDLTETKEEKINPTTKEDNSVEILPFFFNNNQNEQTNNTIEEVKPINEEEIIDPLDSVIKLDPNYEEIKKTESNNNLKNAINDVRNMVNSLENEGFELKLDEIDLEDTYQITITIKKQD